MANFSELGKRGAKTLYRSEQGNLNHFRDLKSDNKFGSNFVNKRTQANFKKKKEPPSSLPTLLRGPQKGHRPFVRLVPQWFVAPFQCLYCLT